MKLARCSFRAPYECKKDWPESCGVQAGGDGLVIDTKHAEGSYMTAFFEAFPKYENGSSTFIRGEGDTIEEAEEKAWEQHLKFAACNHTNGYDARGYTNGAGFCKDCGMFASKVFPPTTKCAICGELTRYTEDIDGVTYCKTHKDGMPEDKKPTWKKLLEKFKKENIT